MATLNELHALHHPHAFTSCTLWDTWLPSATLWTGKEPQDKYREVFLKRRIDEEGQAYDYGFTFLNQQAIHYGLASPEQTHSILALLDGSREVNSDKSRGADIYHWRFAPRLTTRRNVETYQWVWSAPETIAWGDQVQDGGAVLGFSYYDVMSRLKTRGPDDAWQRLDEILKWFREVQAEGGYRAYYAKPGRGTMQGGGPAGGLGMDQEFMERFWSRR